MREQYYSVSEYQPRDGLLNARIAGMLFEIAPASAVLELSAAGKYPQVRAWIEAVEDLRGQLETAQSRDAASLAWDGAQAILQQMVNMDDPALDAYVARVLAWRSIVAPALNNAASIVDPLVARKNEVTLYLLSAHGVQELLVVPPNATADFKGAKGNIAHGSPVSNKIATVLADKTSVSTPDMSAVKLAESYEEPRFFVLSFLAAGIVAWATGLWWLVFRRRK